MRIPKRYGQSHIDRCPFCDRQAVVRNVQKIPVCSEHKARKLESLRCACGSYLDLQDGRFGPFFTCIKCGAISFSRALEINPQRSHPENQKQPERREMAPVRSDELDFL